MATKIMMPRLGESVIEGTVSSWLKGEGDQVEQYEPILEIETDKVTTEAIAEVGGTILKILVPQGETVAVGTVLALIGEPGEAIQDADGAASLVSETKTAPVEQVSTDSALPPAVTKTIPSNGPPHTQRPYSGRISPVVGRIAGEHNVDLTMVPGSGRQGRITKKDILAYLESRDVGAPLPATDKARTSGKQAPVSKLIPGELLPMTGIRRAIAEHMVRSKRTSPHVTTVFDLDFTAVTAHRSANKERFALEGVNLTFTAYIMAAIVQGLARHPLVNSSWNDAGINLKKEINVGMATAIPDGLIVPVIKNADGLDLLALARAINDLSDRARRGRLLPDEVQDGTFTLTNHGVSGSLFATPIINQPQCAILGVGKIEKRVKVINDAIAIRPMAFASLTFDHRILDGLSADGFMVTVKDVIEKWS
jgi:2-oxoglutarate dehydrogenase E2 component (dihydrolipoamide succinyltransferase)